MGVQPATGALLTGAIAVLVLGTLRVNGITGGGYDTLREALLGHLPLLVLLVLCVAKTASTLLSYSSGGAGGAILGGAIGGGKGALIGGILGAVGGFAGDRLTKGENAEVKSGTEFGVYLNRSISLPKFTEVNQ